MDDAPYPQWILSLCLVVSLLGSDGCSPDWSEGSVAVRFIWEHQPEGSFYVWVSVEERDELTRPGDVLAQIGPIEYVPEEGFSETLRDVPNGSRRVVIVELRDGPSEVFPILFYGLSEHFSVQPGSDCTAAVEVALRSIDEVIRDASVRLLFEDKTWIAVNSARASSALVGTTSSGARSIVVSNSPTFNLNRQTFTIGPELGCVQELRDGRTWDQCDLQGWDLTKGLEGEPDGLRAVFVRFVDEYGYESEILSAFVELDTRPPNLEYAGFSDPFQSGDSENLLIVASGGGSPAPELETHADEPLPWNDAPLFNSTEDFFAAHWIDTVPSCGGLYPAYVQQISKTSPYDLSWQLRGLWGDDWDPGTYMFEVRLTDIAGNQSEPQLVVDVDGNPLVMQIEGGPCTPECGDAACGDDGCGGSCGDCDLYQRCSHGACVPFQNDWRYVKIVDRHQNAYEGCDGGHPGADIDAVEILRDGQVVGAAIAVVEVIGGNAARSFWPCADGDDLSSHPTQMLLAPDSGNETGSPQGFFSLNDRTVYLEMSEAMTNGDLLRINEMVLLQSEGYSVDVGFYSHESDSFVFHTKKGPGYMDPCDSFVPEDPYDYCLPEMSWPSFLWNSTVMEVDGLW